MPVSWWCEHALLPDGAVHPGVRLTVDGDRLTSVRAAMQPDDAQVLHGLTIPGLANTHSHAFHRALRGRTQGGTGTFWTWREQMYQLADLLDPDSYLRLARAVYAEMALAGVTAVGEFHYLHHGPGGEPYQQPNVMGLALVEAAAQAGIRISLLDTCYLTGGIGTELTAVQKRFGDGDAEGWATRVSVLPEGATVRVGAAIHSVRAVPADQIGTVAGWARDRRAPLHVHLSEQVTENDACQHAYGCSPTQLLADTGVLGRHSCAVHATHPSAQDITLMGSSGMSISMCPTTERDLGDGIGPARTLFDAGSPVCLGTDSNSVIDLFEEARELELHERLATHVRGHWSAVELATAATSAGHLALGWSDAGRLEPRALADFVTVRLDSVRTAGVGATLEGVLFAASSSDVVSVVVGGRQVVRDGGHLLVPDVAAELAGAIGALT